MLLFDVDIAIAVAIDVAIAVDICHHGIDDFRYGKNVAIQFVVWKEGQWRSHPDQNSWI